MNRNRINLIQYHIDTLRAALPIDAKDWSWSRLLDGAQYHCDNARQFRDRTNRNQSLHYALERIWMLRGSLRLHAPTAARYLELMK